jgi:hypothetical protein
MKHIFWLIEGQLCDRLATVCGRGTGFMPDIRLSRAVNSQVAKDRLDLPFWNQQFTPG